MIRIVIPAKAGISARKAATFPLWDPGFRRGDDLGGVSA